jgi:hypothetical protein
MVVQPRRSSWLWILMVIPPAVTVVTTVFAPQPHGHWTEHLQGAAMKASQLILLLGLVTMLGWRTLRSMLLTAFAAVAVGIALQAVGDLQVANSIWGTAGDPGFGPGYERGHGNGSRGDALVFLGTLSWAAVVGATRRVPVWLAITAAAMVIIPPPFLWPALGVLVVVLFALTSKAGLDARPREVPGAHVEPTGQHF